MKLLKSEVKVPFLDLKKQYSQIKPLIEKAVLEVLESQEFIMGSQVTSFENNLKEFLGVEYAITVSSGTDALLASLMALGVKEGDEVITTAFSFVATADSIVRLGAKPIFVDISYDDFNIDVTKIESLITKKTKVILPVHLFGQSVDMIKISEIAKKYNLKVVEDSAQAFGSRTLTNKFVGTIGDLGCFSFFPSKNLGGAGDGGLVVTNNSDLAEHIKLLRSHGAREKNNSEVIGGNFRLDAIQAAVINVKMKFVSEWNRLRVEKANIYNNLFREFSLNKYIKLPKLSKGHSFNQYVILTDRRDSLFQFLLEEKVSCKIYYPYILPEQKCFKYLMKREYPIATKISKEIISLPIYPEISFEQQYKVALSIKNFFDKK
ncbi:MAG: DegT/DnrJ/EryC1/StrS family aminotransferase [Calditrichaeota bacterium]|nr:MAG: DegT/DnrJ/EryC1/StrS family aminotransferase [Calditrichota bacterium]